MAPLTAGILLTGAGSAVAAPQAAAPQVPTTVRPDRALAYPTCNDAMHDPHYTKNGGGAIAKLTLKCHHVRKYHYVLALWVCWTKPHVVFPGIWQCKRDRREGYHNDHFNPADGKKYTRYVPRRGHVGHGCGWWVANATITASNPSWSTGYHLHSPHHPHHCW